jgi:hypothetical protein
MPARNNAIALKRLGELLSDVENCVLVKLDQTRDPATGADTYVPTQGKKSAFEGQYNALFNKIKNRENLSVEQFYDEVNGGLKTALEDWIATDNLPCDSATLLAPVLDPFPPPVIINP